MKRLLTILTLACIFNTIGYGQQDAQFTQYMYNMSNINPAYATATEGVLNIGGIYRSQWVGAVGAPTTASLFLQDFRPPPTRPHHQRTPPRVGGKTC